MMPSNGDVICAVTVAVELISWYDRPSSEELTRVERITTMALQFVQQQIHRFIVDAQPLDITHPVDPDALLQDALVISRGPSVELTFNRHMPSMNFIVEGLLETEDVFGAAMLTRQAGRR